MGNSPAVIFQHYRALVTPEAAEKFWRLLPVNDVDADKLSNSSRKDGIDVQTMISIPAEIPDSPYRYVRPGALQGRERKTSNQGPETFTRSTLRAVQRVALMKKHAPP
jgi:hypothetical protein